MKPIQTTILAISLVAFAGNASAIDWNAICCDGGYEYRHPNAWEKEQQRLRDELAAAQKQLAEREREIAALRSGSSDSLRSAQAELDRSKARIAELERQLADRDREIASLRSNAGDSSKLSSQLASTQGDLVQAQSRADDLAKQLAAAQSATAGLQSSQSDKDKLAADLAAAKQRNTDLQSQLAAMGSTAGDKEKLAADLAACQQRVTELEKMLADRDKQLAGLRGDLSAEMAKLQEAQRGLIRALKPQIDQKNITVDLNNERLLINLASGYLFGSGEDQLQPAGTNALKQVGAILKDYPEYKVAVDGHTDNRPIRSALKKKFPTNMELSQARAANAAKALGEGGLNAVATHGYADTKPEAPNTTEAGRAKNRRVEVRVTK